MTDRLDDKPGWALSFAERIQQLVKGAGGPTKVAKMLGKSRGTIDRWQRGLSPDLMDLLPLAISNGRSMDWVLTGYQVRPDLAAWGVSEGFPPREDFGSLPGFVRLQPFRPRSEVVGDRTVEKHDPSEFAVSHAWLDQRGLRAEDARYAIVEDEGLDILVPKGATVVVDNRPAKLRSGLYLVDLGTELVARRLNVMPGGNAELTADEFPSWRYAVSGPDAEKLPLRRIIWFAADL